jgi:hypothetical protein
MSQKSLQRKYCPFMRGDGVSIVCLHEDCMFWRYKDCIIAVALKNIIERSWTK